VNRTIHILCLEAIGDNAISMSRQASLVSVHMGLGKLAPWVAEIVGTHPTFGFAREFLSPLRDYSEANSVGSRGVFLYYQLGVGKIYEVSARLSWKKKDRYFCRQEIGGARTRLTRDEVINILSTKEARPQ
jgi:hypothetical protein